MFVCLSFHFIARKLYSCFWYDVFSLLVLEFSMYFLCRPGFAVRDFINLVLSWNILVSLCMLLECFTGYNNLVWQFCSLRVFLTSVQDILTFIVSCEKSGVILIGLTIYVTCTFFPYYF